MNKGSTIDSILDLGMREITTDKQLRNGTRMFIDPQSNTRYASYKSGYVRRVYPYGNTESMYPLNRRQSPNANWNTNPQGIPVACELISDPVDRLKVIERRARIWKENVAQTPGMNK